MANDRRSYPPCPLLGVSCAIWHDQRVLLVQRRSPPKAGRWALPGGLVELGETCIAAIRREVLEETGLRLENPALVELKDLIDVDPAGMIRRHFVLAVFAAIADTDVVVAGDDAAAAAWVRREAIADYDILAGVDGSIDKSRTVLEA